MKCILGYIIKEAGHATLVYCKLCNVYRPMGPKLNEQKKNSNVLQLFCSLI